jgi:hypothetical protein
MKLKIARVVFNKADEPYAIRLPKNTERFLMQTRDGSTWRWGLNASVVQENQEDFMTVPSAGSWYEDDLHLEEPITVYVACPASGKVLEIYYWVSDPANTKGG